MIRNQRELDQATEQMARMYRALASLREEVLPQSREQFAVFAEGPLEELRRLEAEVYEYCGRFAAEEQDAEVWMRIAGAEIVWPEAPTSVLTNFLDTFRKGVQAAAEWLRSGALSTRPTKALKHACDLRVIGLQPGSLRVGIRLPDLPERAESEREVPERVVREALKNYLTVAAWVGSDAADQTLARDIADAELRKILLTYVKQLAPRPRGAVELVELYGRAVPGQVHVRLTREVHRRIDDAIDSAAAEQIEKFEGEVREIDLDSRTFKLRRVGEELYQVECEFELDLYTTAVEALDRRVEVTGVRRIDPGRGRSTKLKVTRLVILEGEEEGRET
jgi:hypothetical protein